MAQPTEKLKQLAGLIQQAEASRLALTESHARLRRRLDVPTRIKSSIISAPAKWLGGSIAAGLAASLCLRPRIKKIPTEAIITKKQRGFTIGLLTLLFTLSKPAIKSCATNLLRNYLARRLTKNTAHTPPY